MSDPFDDARSQYEDLFFDDDSSTVTGSSTASSTSHDPFDRMFRITHLTSSSRSLPLSYPTRAFGRSDDGENYHSAAVYSDHELSALWPSSVSMTDSSTISGLSMLAISSPSVSLDFLPPDEFPFDYTWDDRFKGFHYVKVAPIRPVPRPLRVKVYPLLDHHKVQKPRFRFWDRLPHELRIYIFSFLSPKERIRASRVSKTFHSFCFDGQLWDSLDATEFYQEIPASSLTKLIVNTGPFLKHLNLRGCIQLEHYKRTAMIAKSCNHLVSTTLEGCRNFERSSLHSLLRGNEHLVHLNLAGLVTLNNSACPIIAASCPNLELLNVSWCQKLEASCLTQVVDSCTKLRDLRACEIRGFDCVRLAKSIFRANTLERLVLNGCMDLDSYWLSTMLHGTNPVVDILTGLPVTPPRKLRHLDLSRCIRLTDMAVRDIAHVTPYLQGLQISRCGMLTNAAFKPIFETTPELTHLEMDEMEDITDELFSHYLAKGPCAGRLEHLSVSYCDNLGDAGLIPIIRNCVRLKSAYLDNTRISDALLSEAAAMVQRRSRRTQSAELRARETLHLAVFDCPNVTWAGILEVLSRNAEIRHHKRKGKAGWATYPTEVVSLKCFYGYQMTVDEHQKRVLRGDLPSARKLEQKWIDHMREEEEDRAGGGLSRRRRRRRRARDAQQRQAAGLGENGVMVSPRAGSLASCAVM